MKDKVARDMVRDVLRDFDYWLQMYKPNTLGDVSIKDCPKCKHEVLAKKIIRDTEGTIFCFTSSISLDSTTQGKPPPEKFQCLTCGSKFTCSEKCVCELIGGKQ